jgi:hypothetical protein
MSEHEDRDDPELEDLEVSDEEAEEVGGGRAPSPDPIPIPYPN